MRIRLLLIFLILSSKFALGQRGDSLRQQMDQIYNFQFDLAEKSLNSYSNLGSSSYHFMLEAQYKRWKYIPIQEAPDSVLENYKRQLLKVEDVELHSALDSVAKVSSHLLLAEYYYNKQQVYKAFQEAYKVYHFISLKLDDAPEQINELWLLPISLYHYYFEYYESQNSLISALSWAFKDGEKEKGLRGLSFLATKDSYGSTEALIYLSHIYLRLENNPQKALEYATQLHKKYPKNLKFYELYIECSLALKTNRSRCEELINTLIGSEKVYFQKYGYAYRALFLLLEPSTGLSKKQQLQQALQKIQMLGGGSHLESLLYTALINEDSFENKEYLEKFKETKRYDYILTEIGSSEHN